MAGDNEGTFRRPYISNGQNLPRPGFPGAGWLSSAKVSRLTNVGAATLTPAQLATGAVLFTGLTAGANITTPTKALLDAMFGADMMIGDTFWVLFGAATAFAATWVAGTGGITLVGSPTLEAGTTGFVAIEKTATGYDWIAM